MITFYSRNDHIATVSGDPDSLPSSIMNAIDEDSFYDAVVNYCEDNYNTKDDGRDITCSFNYEHQLGVVELLEL